MHDHASFHPNRVSRLRQASSLNYVGFRKLQIRAKAKLGSTIAANAELPSREELRSRPFFLQMSDSAPPSTKDFFAAIYVSCGSSSVAGLLLGNEETL